MICKKCHGRGYTLEANPSSDSIAIPCECGGCGIVHCCEGECVDHAREAALDELVRLGQEIWDK